tara:strand:+ start:65 stop:1159 length:1095 start_codon:yes stop_codon:yes gene_type:complete
MRNFLKSQFYILYLRQYILIFLTATVFLFFFISKSFSDQNVFSIENISVEGKIDLNFSRDKYIDKAFIDSFKILMSKILLTRDFKKVNNVKLKTIKSLIKSLQVEKESFLNYYYKANYKINYNEKEVRSFLYKRNISFSQPKIISSVFYPVLFIDGQVQNFNENFFYNKWNEIKIENELIKFILPLEDLEDISELIKMKDQIENLNVDSFVNKYDVKNYVFALMAYENKVLNIHLKTKFNNTLRKNITFKVDDISNEEELYLIVENLKNQITDIWKEENIINLLMPLSIKLKFNYLDLKELDKLTNVFDKIKIVDNYYLEELDIKNSFYKVYYYGDPKKLKAELLNFGYLLKNEKGYWEIYKNE